MAYDIEQRLDRIEQSMSHQLRDIHDKIENATRIAQLIEHFLDFNQRQEALPIHERSSHLQTAAASNRSLRWPHRKILDFLLNQVDPQTCSYKPVQTSTLIRAARIGKQAAANYLADLIESGFIVRWSDGYRVFYRINENFNGDKRGDRAENTSDREWLKNNGLQDQCDARHARV